MPEQTALLDSDATAAPAPTEPSSSRRRAPTKRPARKTDERVEPHASPGPAEADHAPVDASEGAPTPARGPRAAVGDAEAERAIQGGSDAEADDRSVERKRRIEAQLAELERKKAELHRALAIAEHPDLEDAIREVEGRAYGVTRAQERLDAPLTKAEQRRRERLEKKLATALDKRAKLDAQIESLQAELAPLGEARREKLGAERDRAMRELLAVLAQHAPALERAGLQAAELVPDVARWLPELRTLADAHADADEK
ncbi:MAG TPA: hypothetical protein RMH99_11545 [Sandaracinaceae bacterium LLY-WYZ-13_1]|nr:hypothetical protein [Sandaracinaceae bacterium LLY-WYZ-13_1]